MSRDVRKYARQTSVQLIVGGLLLLFIVGDGLIYLIYGPGAAFSGLLCFGVGLIPVILTLIVLFIVDFVVKRANQN